MKKFRKCIFETNSSSTHSITIANNLSDDFKNNLPDELVFDAGEYGWEFKRYQSVKDRADYLFTAILYCELCDEYLPKIKEILAKWGVKAVFPELIKKYYDNCWRYTLASDEYNDYDSYYIDHGDNLKDFLAKVCNDETLLMNYLFSDESFISTGNDNTERELDCNTNANNILFEYYKTN